MCLECITYLFSWNHDSNLFNSFSKLLWIDCSTVVQVKVLERLLQDCFLGGHTWWLLLQLILQFFLKTKRCEISKLHVVQHPQEVMRKKWELTLLLTRPYWLLQTYILLQILIKRFLIQNLSTNMPNHPLIFRIKIILFRIKIKKCWSRFLL